MGKGLNEHYLKKELYQLIKTDSTLFDFIQESSLDGMWYWNLENIEDEWLSPRFWEVLGYDPKKKKHSSKEWQDIIFKDDRKEATKNFEMHLKDPKHPYDQIVRYKHKDGSTVWIRCRGIAIRDASGKAVRMLGAHTNITNQQDQIIELNHLAEMSEQLLAIIGKEVDYQKISDHLLNITNAKFVAFNLYDEDGKHYITKAISGNKGSINKAMDMMGIKLDKRKWNHDSARADKIKDKIVTHFPTLHDLAEGIIPKSLCTLLIKSFGLGEIVLVKIEKDNFVIGDFILIMPKGKDFDKDNIVEIYANNLGLVLSNFWSNEKSKESEQRFRITLQSLDDGVIIHALDGSIIDSNNRALKILGLSRNQILGKTAFDPVWKFVDGNEKPLLHEEYPVNRILANKKPINNLTMGIVQSANQEIVWVQVNGTPIFDHQGHFKEVVISFFDITELKKSYKRVRESEQRFKVLHNASFGGIAIHNKGIILDCNQGLSDISGFSMDELVGMDGLLLIAPEYRDFVMTKIVTGYEKPYEVFGIRKNKEIYPLKLEARNIPYDGKQVRIVEFRDITKLKQKENLLIESEKRFRNLFEKAPFGYQSLDDSGHFVDVNEKWLEIMGYQKEEVIGKWFGDFLVPEMKEQFKKRFEMFKERGSVHSEFSMKTKEGNIILVGFDGNVSYDENHAFIQTHCTVSDITEINIANNKLKQRNALIEGLFNHMTSGVAIYEVINDGLRGSDYIIKDFNDTSLMWENKSRDEVVGKAISELHPNIDDSGIIEVFRNVWKTGKATNSPARYFVNGNYKRWHDNRIFKLPSGEIVAMYDDVTERVLIEKQREKEQRDLLTSQKVAKLGTWRLDVKTNEVTWSEELYKMYGFDPTQPIPPYTEHMKLFTKQSWDKLSNALALTRTKGIPYELELEMSLKDESRGWMWVKGEAEYDDQGQIVSLTGAAQDITQRKAADAEVEYRKNLLQYVISHGNQGIAVHDKNLNYVYVSDKYCNMYHVDKDIIGKHHYEVFPDLPQKWRDVHQRTLKGETLKGDRDVFERADGSILYTRWLSQPWYDAHGKIAGIIIYTEIINELISTEVQLQKTVDQLQLVMESLPIGIALNSVDPVVEFEYMNNNFAKIYGTTQSKLKKSNSFWDVIYEDAQFREEIKTKVLSDIASKDSKRMIWEDIPLTKNGKTTRYISAYATPIPDSNQLITTVIDVTDRKQKEEDIIYASNHDFLTGLPNRKYFEERIIELDKKKCYPLLIAMIDLDGLKLINDAYGHDIGDESLKKVSKILNDSFRESDFIARIGGDEFIILCPNTTPDEFDKVKNSMLDNINFISVEDVKVSLSIGYDVKNDISMNIDEILKNAENDMYSNKILHGQSARNETIMTLFETLNEKYEEEKIHSNRVSLFCKQMGEKLKLSIDQVKELEFAGLMHDIGKITIPDSILDKPGNLTDEEWVIMKKHAINGYNILRSADKYSRLAEYALTHHERWDGKGYPNGLKGEDIPLFSRIISISDAYEAMTADRPYRKALDKKVAVEELYRCAGSQFDETLVEIFVKEVIQE